MTSSTDSYMRDLEVVQPLREETLRSVIAALALPQGSSGIDVGCGIGLPAFLLADAIGPEGRVTGFDISPEFLTRAKILTKQRGLTERVTFQQGSVDQLPFEDNSFDWAWSADCIGYGTSNTPVLIQELARVVRPGGLIAVLAWASERLLPGYPALEARLGSTESGIAPYTAGMEPQSHFSLGLGWFRDAGLRDLRCRAFAGSVYAPLSDKIRDAMVALMGMRWPNAYSELAPEDQAEYSRLCEPESPDFILDHPDYYGFFTYSVLEGTKPA